jgi:DNA-binding MarR family transcriptional regulator
MDLVSDIAPEVDRLVLSTNGRVRREHGDRLMDVARGNGLNSLTLIPQLAPFIAGGRLTRDLATVRMRYLPQDRLDAWIDELAESGLLQPVGATWQAGPALAVVLREWASALREVTREEWGGQPEAVEAASATARRVGAAATDEHVVAVVHRGLPEPSDPHLRLHQHLVTLRFIRQHDHAEAWLSHGLTAGQMVVLTALWHGNDVDAYEVVDELNRRGYVDPAPVRLSAEGKAIRDEIEAETNRRNAETFAVLTRAEAGSLLESLRRLPGSV